MITLFVLPVSTNTLCHSVLMNLKVQTPCRFLKKGERPSDHCTMITKINIPKRSNISAEKKKTVWNFQDKEGWEKFRSMTKADKNLTSIWEQQSGNICITDTYSKWSCKLNKILHICFRDRKVRDKPCPYTSGIRGLLEAKQNLKKKVRVLSEGKEKDVSENHLSKMSRVINQKIDIFHLNLLSTHLDKDGSMSQQNFWKVKKKLSPKAQSVPHAVIDNLGNEITEPSNIKKLYQFIYSSTV